VSEWEEKLNTLLGDPDAMAQVTALAQSLSQKTGGETAPESPPAAAPEGGTDTLSALLAQLGGTDPELTQRLLPVVQQLGRPESSEAAAFLHALRPFLREDRRDKIERAAQLARLVHLAKVFLTAKE